MNTDKLNGQRNTGRIASWKKRRGEAKRERGDGVRKMKASDVGFWCWKLMKMVRSVVDWRGLYLLKIQILFL